MSGCEKLLGKPDDIAKKIMQQIIDELDLWCSIGISENKFLAKMASERKKPLGITEIWESDVKRMIFPLKVREMYGIGKQTEQKLSKLSIYTIGDLANISKVLLLQHFGKYGEELQKLANGIDNTPVNENPHYDSKSISRSTTLPEDIYDIEYAKKVLFQLSDEVGSEARKHASKGKTVSIVIKYNDFTSFTRQKSVTNTYLTRDIYNLGIALLEENWNKKKGIRLLGIGLSNFDDKYSEQISFFDLDISKNSNDSIQKEETIEKAIDNIRDKFGNNIIKRAKVIKAPNK